MSAGTRSLEHRALRALVRSTLLAGLLLLTLGLWFKDALPPPALLHADLLREPAQVAMRAAPFKTVVDGVEYLIEPRYTYDIAGLVVSLHQSDDASDTAHRAWDDHINLIDLCLVWGQNARSGIYRELRFTNSQWTCRMSSPPGSNWQAFDRAQASNNHMVTDQVEVGRALKRIHVGDQVRIRGYLVDYTSYRDGKPFAKRVSSDSRTDEDCEVIYATSIEALASSRTISRLADTMGIVLLLLGGLAWSILPAPPGVRP
jgi:hypothetical protein